MPTFQELLNSGASRICAIAVPGSGKTSGILIPKATQILTQVGVDPKQVLLLTFSRLSALDLKGRVKTMERVPRASTVHSFCLSFLLSEDNHQIRKRVDSVLLDFEKGVLVSELKLVFPKKDKRQLKKDLDAFSAGWATKPHDQVFEESDDRRAFQAAVLNWLTEHEAAMMEEIIYFAVDLAKKLGNPSFIDDPQYILVDEYQDLNKLEQEFIDLLAANSKLLLVVGDPDQSIYGFKFAYPEGILEFSKQPSVDLHRSLETHRCPGKVIDVANQLLRQADPERTQLLTAAPAGENGDAHFIQKDTQEEEFRYVLDSITKRIRSGASPSQILVLVPRKKLGRDFAQFVAHELEIKTNVNFSVTFVQRPDFSVSEQEKILLFGLLANPSSLMHIRSYLGLGEGNWFAAEIGKIKERYGGLADAVRNAHAADFLKKQRRVRTVCERIQLLRDFLDSHANTQDLNSVLDELLPTTSVDLADLRRILTGLREDGDTVATLYAKFLDFTRTIPCDNETTVRVMTLMGSKGLQAEHIYVLGCNAGNVPGENRSAHMTDQQHRMEQRRLLYVAFTRASKSLTVSWSRYILFSQSKGHYTTQHRLPLASVAPHIAMEIFESQAGGPTIERPYRRDLPRCRIVTYLKSFSTRGELDISFLDSSSASVTQWSLRRGRAVAPEIITTLPEAIGTPRKKVQVEAFSFLWVVFGHLLHFHCSDSVESRHPALR